MTAGRRRTPASRHWCTPPDLLDAVRDVWDGIIDLDPCSNPSSVVGAAVEYRLPAHDGLVEPWVGSRIFVNPPYGADRDRGTTIADWFARAVEAHHGGATVIMVVPVAPNTAHWKTSVFGQAAAVCFLYEPRVKFFLDGVRDTKGAPMACAVIYYGRGVDRFAAAFRQFGAVVPLDGVTVPRSVGATIDTAPHAGS